jgi:hypothetical protein
MMHGDLIGYINMRNLRVKGFDGYIGAETSPP